MAPEEEETRDPDQKVGSREFQEKWETGKTDEKLIIQVSFKKKKNVISNFNYIKYYVVYLYLKKLYLC